MPRTDITWSGVTENAVPSVARTTNANTATLGGFGSATTLRSQLNVTAVSGTSPTLNVVIEDTLDGTNWNTVGTFAQKTTTGLEVINVTTPFSDQLRIRWTIGGTATPTFTFTVDWTSQ